MELRESELSKMRWRIDKNPITDYKDLIDRFEEHKNSRTTNLSNELIIKYIVWTYHKNSPFVERFDNIIERKAEVLEWKAPRLAPAAKLTYAFTLTGDIPASPFLDSRVQWSKPEIRRPANQTLKDPRVPDKPGFKGDWISTVGVAQRPDGRVLPLFITPVSK